MKWVSQLDPQGHFPGLFQENRLQRGQGWKAEHTGSPQATEEDWSNRALWQQRLFFWILLSLMNAADIASTCKSVWLISWHTASPWVGNLNQLMSTNTCFKNVQQIHNTDIVVPKRKVSFLRLRTEFFSDPQLLPTVQLKSSQVPLSTAEVAEGWWLLQALFMSYSRCFWEHWRYKTGFLEINAYAEGRRPRNLDVD
jgi:hypothetical protein